MADASALIGAAQAAVARLAVGPADDLLVVCDDDQKTIAAALEQAANTGPARSAVSASRS